MDALRLLELAFLPRSPYTGLGYWPGFRPIVMKAKEHNLGCQLTYPEACPGGGRIGKGQASTKTEEAWFLGKTSACPCPCVEIARHQQYCAWGLSD